jgi:low affinity Fe/Cu permease
VAIDFSRHGNLRLISGMYLPQGSVLGPILFLKFMNDVTSICSENTTVKLFVDDLKLYSAYNIGDNSSDLQQSIDRVVNWSKLWQLQINLNKCIMFFLFVLSLT